jgi:hypothetical protein
MTIIERCKNFVQLNFKAVIIFLLAPLIWVAFSFANKPEILRISFPLNWGILEPAKLNNFAGTLILTTQFKFLTRFNAKGLIVPNFARSWKFGPNKKVSRFKIDSLQKFSDGITLIFKKDKIKLTDQILHRHLLNLNVFKKI